MRSVRPRPARGGIKPVRRGGVSSPSGEGGFKPVRRGGFQARPAFEDEARRAEKAGERGRSPHKGPGGPKVPPARDLWARAFALKQPRPKARNRRATEHNPPRQPTPRRLLLSTPTAARQEQPCRPPPR
ncbi:hypothetical protein GCM10010252_13510 [Streptomyces aureoverticillatus]|nr:hypothetical protein GCM10010252_13510 [Streptomyces aureoverticillatus]